ncbi:MAG TPA: TetR/AcrR family transcriptional regulator [bacterium]|nr:TetR/AcrR family transcriptional regulator [bacterium]
MSRTITKRQHVLDAALKLFVEKGIEGTTTREIAQLANAGEGTMFRHFQSKEDMAWHLFHENLSSFMKHLEEGVAAQTTSKAKVESMIKACYDLYESDALMASFLLLTEHSAARRMDEDYRTPITLLVEVIEEGQKTSEIRAMDSQLAAALVFGAVLRVPFFKRYRRITRDLREMVDEVTESVWQMIKGS